MVSMGEQAELEVIDYSNPNKLALIRQPGDSVIIPNVNETSIVGASYISGPQQNLL